MELYRTWICDWERIQGKQQQKKGVELTRNYREQLISWAFLDDPTFFWVQEVVVQEEKY